MSAYAERLRLGLSDSLVLAGRNLSHIRQIPEKLIDVTVQPLMFVILFAYVFGGAIAVPGGSYHEYLMGGIFIQTLTFGVMGPAMSMATDLGEGVLDRFRSLPMARSAVLVGRTFADLARNVFVVILMAVVGFAVGFRIHTNFWAFAGSLILVLLFGYSMSWIFATVGLAVGDPETAQAAAFPVLAPLVFASSVFIPVDTMPGWLQPFAEHQPVSVTANAVRALVVGGPTTSYVLQSLAWVAAILIVFAPIAVWRYRRAV
jgi:ABC transporter DrrB family efflux protein